MLLYPAWISPCAQPSSAAVWWCVLPRLSTPRCCEQPISSPHGSQQDSPMFPPALSKICERVALNQFTEYLTRCNRLTNHQSGNKKSHSTETLNIFITDTIFKAMDSRRVTALVLMDLSKAFDSIDHTILLRKLRALGVSQPALEWSRSYLYNRTQSVRIESYLSDALPLSHGVPQGSILGPLLFNVCINDLPTVPKACSVESYVDDSKLYLTFQSKDADLAIETMCEDLKTVAAWFCSNSLLINPDKTKLLGFGTIQMLSNVSSNFKLSLLGKELSPVPFAKDLEVFMDSTLSFDEHVMQITSKCIASLCQINRVRHVLDKKTLTTVINALVFSRLFYCSSVWGGISMKNVLKLHFFGTLVFSINLMKCVVSLRYDSCICAIG